MLLTQDSEYLIGFLNLLWEHCQSDCDFQIAKIANFRHLGLFSPTLDTPFKRGTYGNGLHCKSNQN